MKKQAIIIIVVVFLAFSAGAYFWMNNLLNEAAEDESKSAAIAPGIRNLFASNQSVNTYPYRPGKPDWKGKYLALENRYTDGMSAQYSSNWNKKLGTDGNFPGNDAKGIVMIALVIDDEGSYENTSKKAFRQSYVISYMDLEQKAVIARDTLRGEEPPERIRSTESGLGDPPDEDLVVNTIQKRLK